jgi:hypothetical protein
MLVLEPRQRHPASFGSFPSHGSTSNQRDHCMKLFAPAAERNRAPILDVLRRVLPIQGHVLEIASGTGVHAAFMAQHLPHIVWQPSDPDPEALESIEAYRAELNTPNLRAPLRLDACAQPWPIDRADAVVCINMIHIAPWDACEGLFRGARRHLGSRRLLYLYGPFRFDGEFTAPSNAAFDASLRERNPAWGVRDVSDLRVLARENELSLEETVPMPANNHSLIFRRCDGAG